MNENQEVLNGLREGLEAGLIKSAGVATAAELSDDQKRFIDLTVENFEKTAGWSDFVGAMSGKNVGEAVVKTGIPLLGGLGVAAGASAIRAIAGGMNRSKFEAALRMAIGRNSVLQHADQERVKSLADSIYATAPSVSTDPNILGQVLSNAIRGDNLDIQTVKMLAELESRRGNQTPLTARNFSL